MKQFSLSMIIFQLLIEFFGLYNFTKSRELPITISQSPKGAQTKLCKGANPHIGETGTK